MSTAAWIVSFLYLAALLAWVAHVVKEPEPGEEPDPEDGAEAPLWRRALSFFFLIVGGIVVFCALIWGIQVAT